MLGIRKEHDEKSFREPCDGFPHGKRFYFDYAIPCRYIKESGYTRRNISQWCCPPIDEKVFYKYLRIEKGYRRDSIVVLFERSEKSIPKEKDAKTLTTNIITFYSDDNNFYDKPKYNMNLCYCFPTIKSFKFVNKLNDLIAGDKLVNFPVIGYLLFLIASFICAIFSLIYSLVYFIKNKYFSKTNLSNTLKKYPLFSILTIIAIGIMIYSFIIDNNHLLILNSIIYVIIVMIMTIVSKPKK